LFNVIVHLMVFGYDVVSLFGLQKFGVVVSQIPFLC
jgi:hypothetical protein